MASNTAYQYSYTFQPYYGKVFDSNNTSFARYRQSSAPFYKVNNFTDISMRSNQIFKPHIPPNALNPCHLKKKIPRKEYFLGYFYKFLYRYCVLSVGELANWGYPMKSITDGSVSYYESEFFNSEDNHCARCHAQYKPNLQPADNTDEDAVCCAHHPQKAISVCFDGISYIHPCCNKEKGSTGCITYKYHVSSKKCLKTDMFLLTEYCDSMHENIICLDTEMCYTRNGLEVTKVTLISGDGSLLYETYVKPESPIIDYNTEFSGITAEMLENVTATLKGVQEVLLDFINCNTILIGHGLDNDLKALRIVHYKIVDTSILFPDHRGYPYRSSLKLLAQEMLGREIHKTYHDSKEDAQVCLDLVLYKWKQML